MEKYIDINPYTLLIAIIASVIGWKYWRMHVRIRREDFIRRFRFPRHVLAELHRQYPDVRRHHLPLIESGLREFFLGYIHAGYREVAMPSRIVDELWRRFALDTRGYADFCRRAFGRTLPYAPAIAISDRYEDNVRLRRTWWHVCDLYDLDPKHPLRLPLLFAIDTKLKIADGYRYRLEDPSVDSPWSSTAAPAAGSAISISVMIDVSFDGTTDGLGPGDGDGGGDGGDGDGGGCGGD